MQVFVLNQDGTPLMPTTPARARRKLRDGKAVVERLHPFTIRLTYQIENPGTQEVSVGIDDGAKTAGVAVVQHNENNDRVVFKAEIKLRNNVKRELSKRRSRSTPIGRESRGGAQCVVSCPPEKW